MPVLTIRFINSSDLISRAITGETFSYICHTEGLNEAGDAWVGAHAFTGVQERALDWADNGLIWERRYAIPVTQAQYDAAMVYMRASIGVKYNYRGIVGLLLHNRKWNDTERMDCSQFMFRWLLAGGKESLNVLDSSAWLVTPETLHLSPLLIGKCIYSKTNS